MLLFSSYVDCHTHMEVGELGARACLADDRLQYTNIWLSCLVILVAVVVHSSASGADIRVVSVSIQPAAWPTGENPQQDWVPQSHLRGQVRDRVSAERKTEMQILTLAGLLSAWCWWGAEYFNQEGIVNVDGSELPDHSGPGLAHFRSQNFSSLSPPWSVHPCLSLLSLAAVFLCWLAFYYFCCLNVQQKHDLPAKLIIGFP